MTITTPDAQLVAGHLAGDPSALAGIYDRFADSLYDTAAAMLSNRDDAADVMQDVFLIAASKLEQLRDPDRLKPWLFAILRNEVYRRTKQRKRTIATDFSNDDMAAASGFDMTDERGLDADTEAVESTELAELVRGAAGGLDERDQLVLELSVRQGLEGQDLADALGVSPNQSYTLVHRMRDRVEKSLGAFCVAKAGRKDCNDLDAILGAWDGEFTVLVRKRVARHIERCETCATSRRKVAPLALFAGAPAFAAPAMLRDRILDAVQMQTVALGNGGVPSTPYEFTADGGFPRIVSAGRKLAAWIAPTAAASLLLVAAGAGFWFLGLDDQPGTFESAAVTTVASPDPTIAVASGPAPATTTTAPAEPRASTASPLPPSTVPVTTPPPTTVPPTAAPPLVVAPPVAPAPPLVTNPPRDTPPPSAGKLVGSDLSITLGNDNNRTFTLSNPGGQPVGWAASSASPFSMSPAAGTLAPGSSTPITINLDRSNMTEGSDPSTVVTFSGDGGQSFPLTISATVNRPPVISNVDGASLVCSEFVGGAAITTFWEASISASITDESVGSATFSITGPGGRSGSTTQAFSGNWFALTGNPNGDQIQPSADGTWNWNIVATDSRGNTSSTSGSASATCL